MAEVLVSMKNIQKRFPGVHALDDAQLELRAGEVLGLVGENGAGKSTLMKILCGIYSMDSGEIEICGKQEKIDGPIKAQSLGISIIHQELNLMRDLTVAENMFIGREPMKGMLLDKKKQTEMAREVLTSHNINIDPSVTVKTLTVAKQQMVEIAKALSYETTKILIMDEPSAALTTTEIEDLFRFIRELKEKGVGIIYISHRMDELSVITDRITVMRDGQYVDTKVTKDTAMSDIISLMVGRVIYEEPKQKSNVAADAPVILEAKHLKSKQVKDVSFSLRKGEILGFAGLVGAGRTETARLIFGADKMDSGEVVVNGKPVAIRTPQDAVEAGIGYLSEDRKQFGLCLGLSVADNTAMATLDEFTNGLVVNDAKIKQKATEYVKEINIKTPTVETKVLSLSGGNQQKVVIAKWLAKNCDILIFDEPTRGIDVGAKAEIYRLMNELINEGKSIIMISSEMPELLRMSDRVVVMCEGRITGELDIAESTQEKIMTYATQRQ